MSNTENTLERRRSWFSREPTYSKQSENFREKTKEKNIQIVSSSTKHGEDLKKEESCVNGEDTEIDKESSLKQQLGEVKAINDKNSSRRSSLIGHLLSLTKSVENLEEAPSGAISDRNYSSSGQSSEMAMEDDGDVSVRPRSQSFLGHSVTPLKIRDSLNYLFGLEEGDAQANADMLVEPKSSGETVQIPKLYSRPHSRESHLNDAFVSTHPGIPCNRMALLDHHQKLAFAFELNFMRNATKNFNFYHRWAVWLVSDTEGKKTSTIDRLIENKYDLKVFMKRLKKITEKNEYYKIHIFQFGLIPRRNDKKLIKGVTLDFKVSTSLSVDFVRDMITITVNNELYRPETIQLPVCGITYRSLKNYSIVSMWILLSTEDAMLNNSGSSEDIVKLINFLKDSLNVDYATVLESAMIVKNDTLTATKVFEDPITRK